MRNSYGHWAVRQAHPIHSSELQAGAAKFDELGELSRQRVVSIDCDTVVLLQTHLENAADPYRARPSALCTRKTAFALSATEAP